MTAPRRPRYGHCKSRCSHTPGFTLVEMLLTLMILGMMLYASVSTLESLRSTSRLTAAQQLVAAAEEARSQAIRNGSPSLIVFRQTVDEFGIMTCREFGLLQRKAGVHAIVWRQLPNGIVLWPGQPEQVLSGTNLMSVQPQSPVQRGFTGLGKDGYESHISLVFGDLGEVVFPSAQPTAPDAAAAPGPYYLCVAEAEQTLSSKPPKNMQLIEIRPTTGRAQLLP